MKYRFFKKKSRNSYLADYYIVVETDNRCFIRFWHNDKWDTIWSSINEVDIYDDMFVEIGNFKAAKLSGISMKKGELTPP